MMKLEKEMSTRANSDDVDALLRRCTALESDYNYPGRFIKSNQGSNETGLMGEIDAQVGGNKASVVADLAKNSWDQLRCEEKEMEVRKMTYSVQNNRTEIIIWT